MRPRLIGMQWQPCCRPPSAGAAECDDLAIADRADAVRLLALQPQCTDEAISALQRLAPRDTAAMSDLAAAYAVRAERADQPTDDLRVWEAVQHALNSSPSLPAALFNRALIEEALGLPASWDEVIRNDHSQWGDEARQHRDRLRRESARDALQRWTEAKARLQVALRGGDRATVARLIAPFPWAAEHELATRLKTWANTPSKQDLTDSLLLGAELSRLTGDRFATDAAEAAAEAKLLGRTDDAYRLSLKRTPDALARAAVELKTIEREARARGCERIALHALVTHAYCRLYQNQFMDSLADYDKAVAEYSRLHDKDALTDTVMRRISALRELGQSEIAWRETLAVIRDAWQMTQLSSRQALMNDVCSTTHALGFPGVGLRYANAAVELDRHAEPSHTTQVALAGAYSVRAKMESALGRIRDAEADLSEAVRLGSKTGKDEQRILAARTKALQGGLLLRGNPKRAIAQFDAALKLISPESTTVRVSLLAQRADAWFALGQNDAAERDLSQAMNILHREESVAVTTRAQADQDYWSSYFSRFQGAFGRLIRYLIEQKRDRHAFEYVERARAFEPLNLVMQPDAVDAITLEEIRAALPPGRFILEYSLLDDRTIVWIISRDDFRSVTLPVSRDRVAAWSSNLQRAANRRNDSDFEAGLRAPFVELLERPLNMIGGRANELVIVPDGPLHALPFAALYNPLARRYLIQDYTIATAGSAKLYLVSLRRDRALAASNNTKILLVGDPPANAQLLLRRGLGPLPHAQEEVRRIRDLYRDAEVLLGPEATVPRFLARAPRSAVIHIAAHGLANAARPSHSLIVLAPSDGDSGVLDAAQLLEKAKLHDTRLVVLSACSSAGGLPIGPEGVAPLVRPLIAAGVPAVIGSLWDVNDATAEELLVSFHRLYGQKGLDAAAAMQAAQLEMLGNTKKPGLQRPSAWASFEVIGYSSSPFAAPGQ